MKLDRNLLIEGQPILKIRDILKKNYLIDWEILSTNLNTSKEEGEKVLNSLIEKGYLEKEFESKDGFELHKKSALGISLSLAKAIPPISFEKANQIFFEFLERVKTVNTTDQFIYKIEKVYLFGSYQKKENFVNDIDLHIILKPKIDDKETFNQIAERKIKNEIKSGRVFKNMWEEICWPDIEVYRYLKNRSPYLSFMEANEKFLDKSNAELVFSDIPKETKKVKQKGISM